jgi:hypothetical protein
MKIILSLLILCCLFSCKPASTIDFESETKKILALDAEAKAFHFNKDAKGLVATFSKDFLSINRGKIEFPSAANSYQKFDSYFKSVTFMKWDNNKEPIIRFSDDATIAYAAIDKTVILKLADENGKETMDTTNFAWLSVYKKVKGQWVLDCITSTTRESKRYGKDE